MATLIALPDELSERLKPQAADQHMALDAYVIELLHRFSSQPPTTVFVEPLEIIVARIKTLPPSAAKLYPGTNARTGMLARFVEDTTFDAEGWNRQWASIEADMKAVSRIDRMTEGRA
jgi:hypothetical protein